MIKVYAQGPKLQSLCKANSAICGEPRRSVSRNGAGRVPENLRLNDLQILVPAPARHRAQAVDVVAWLRRTVWIVAALTPWVTASVAAPASPPSRRSVSSIAQPSWLSPGSVDLAPKIFNATREARGGDIISIQGTNLDSSTVASLEGPNGTSTNLPIVNRVEGVQLSLQLPNSLIDPVLLKLKNDNGTSDVLPLNAASPQTLDATRLVPDGRFRLFGRSLKVVRHEPQVTIDGQPAIIDLDASSETMLVGNVPPRARPTRHADIAVDNGNGTGATHLAASVSIEQGSGDPLALGVGWAAGFDFVNHVIAAQATCDGTTDVTEAIEAAVQKAVSDGGGVVSLPGGTCRVAGTIKLASRVVLRGAGQDRTILVYGANYPIQATGADLVGLQDLQLRNGGAVQEGMLWRDNTRSVIQRVTFDMQKSRQWFLTANRDIVFDHNTIVQTDSFDEQNPYRFDDSSGLVFAHNRSINVAGSPTFQRVHDSVFIGNHFSRDASRQDETPVVAHHQFVIDFAYRVAIVGNLFDVANGPITNTLRNDGETILVEGGGPSRTEHTGTVADATGRTLMDPDSAIDLDPFKTGLPWNYAVAIVSGKGTGQTRRITGFHGSTLAVDHDWDVVPTSGSHYATFVWGLKDVLIEGNTLRDNPRGIWLYSSSVDDIDIVDNEITDGGGIYLRSFQKLDQHWFNIQMNVTIAGNTLIDRTGRWMSHIILENVRSDPLAFGIGNLGTEVRRNMIVAHIPNVSSQQEEYASREGYVALVHSEGGAGQMGDIPATLAPIFQDNVCKHCEMPFVLGTEVYGANIAGDLTGPDRHNVFDNVKTLGNSAGGATSTLIQ